MDYFQIHQLLKKLKTEKYIDDSEINIIVSALKKYNVEIPVYNPKEFQILTTNLIKQFKKLLKKAEGEFAGCLVRERSHLNRTNPKAVFAAMEVENITYKNNLGYNAQVAMALVLRLI